MYELKPLAPEAIERALEKADRYRFLKEAGEAESICLDVLSVDAENQRALITLILALTDQFESGRPVKDALALLSGLKGEYDRAYYAGIVHERHAKAQLAERGPSVGAYHLLQAAMSCYEKAEALREPGNDDALLRWNTCARLLERSPQITHAVGADLLE
jgi:hypothetical protein